MNLPFFSIVMPVYNVEKYLEQALESILKQSFDDFEVILVDDCSPDGSPVLCDRYAQMDDRIKVIHLEVNGGVSNARNIGMNCALGQYLMFMDSDDYIDTELFQEVYDSLEKNSAQIVFFGMTEEHFDKNGNFIESVIFNLPKQYFEEQNALRAYMLEVEKSTLYGYACNKFYDLAYLRQLHLKYQEYALNEDILFNIAYCKDIKKMNITGNPSYHYRKVMDDSSRTAKFVKEYFKLHVKKIQALYNQYKYWDMCDTQVRGALALIYTRYIMSALQRNCDPRSGMNFSARRRWLKRLYQQKLFCEIMPYGKTKNPVVGVMHWCLKHNHSLMALTIGRFIYIVKSKLPGIFNIVQKNR